MSTVDGFQGHEKELVVVSCVRANEMRRGGLGFTDARRVDPMPDYPDPALTPPYPSPDPKPLL